MESTENYERGNIGAFCRGMDAGTKSTLEALILMFDIGKKKEQKGASAQYMHEVIRQMLTDIESKEDE